MRKVVLKKINSMPTDSGRRGAARTRALARMRARPASPAGSPAGCTNAALAGCSAGGRPTALSVGAAAAVGMASAVVGVAVAGGGTTAAVVGGALAGTTAAVEPRTSAVAGTSDGLRVGGNMRAMGSAVGEWRSVRDRRCHERTGVLWSAMVGSGGSAEVRRSSNPGASSTSAGGGCRFEEREARAQEPVLGCDGRRAESASTAGAERAESASTAVAWRGDRSLGCRKRWRNSWVGCRKRWRSGRMSAGDGTSGGEGGGSWACARPRWPSLCPCSGCRSRVER